MRKILIKILFRLLVGNETFQDINDKKIDDWLVRQHSDIGFREYFRKRDLQILKTIGTGLEMNSYNIHLGQRLELLLLLQRVDVMKKKADRDKPKPNQSKLNKQ